MTKQISATDAKNNFGGLLDDVATLGRVDIVKHGRLVAVILSPSSVDGVQRGNEATEEESRRWGRNHMIPPELARGARMRGRPRGFDED